MTAKCECRMGTVESNFSKSVENIAFYKYVLWCYSKYLPFLGYGTVNVVYSFGFWLWQQYSVKN